MNDNINQTNESEKTIDIGKLLRIFLSRWYVVAASVIICLAVAYVKLRYTKPTYKASLSLKYDDEKGGQMSDIFKFGKISGRIENTLYTEAEVISSRNVNLKTHEYLKNYTSTFTFGNIITSELYPNNYFSLNFIYLDTSDIGDGFYLKFTGDNKFELLGDKESKGMKFSLTDTFVFGESVLSFNIDNVPKLKRIQDKLLYVRINNLNEEASYSSQNLAIQIEKGTSVLRLSYTSSEAQFASDYVNALAAVYMQETVLSKSIAIEQTIQYIDDKLVELSENVNQSQGELADFKSQNKGIQPSDVGRVEFDLLVKNEAQKDILLLRKSQLKNLEENVLKAQSKTVELVSLDPDDASSLSGMFDLLNSLILEHISLTSRNKPESPVMQESEKKIRELKSSLVRTLQSVQQNLDAKIASVQKEIDKFSANLKKLPAQEQALFKLEQAFKINDKIYAYLQEKRLENSINLSSITSPVSIIDTALTPLLPISPKPKIYYLIALILGLGIGAGAIALTRELYHRIPDVETIEQNSKTPVIGIIKKITGEKVSSDYNIHVLESPKSIFAESIRAIRTNINFLLSGDKHKLICVTSTVSGEGKTFCTNNIAASLTLLGYKVVVVGCDLRRPKIHLSFQGLRNDVGATTYLVKKHKYEEIIFETEFKNLYVIPAGPTPPNPSELLQTEEFDNLLTRLKNDFDYVFLDTAPVGLVSDASSILVKADLALYIVRANYSKVGFARMPDQLKQNNKLSAIYTILNSYDARSSVYGSIYKNNDSYYGGNSYYSGGYYGGGYGAHGGYNSRYYSGYYSEEEMKPKSGLRKMIDKVFKRG